MLGQVDYDAIVVGSGFGGATSAHVLVGAGWRVLMLERGDWVARGPHNWEPGGSIDLTPCYSKETPYDLVRNGPAQLPPGLSGVLSARVNGGGGSRTIGGYYCVGGPSVFYGGVTLRLREGDFEPAPEIVTDSGAEWPYRYADLQPFYERAERLLGVAGEVGPDPTEPPRRDGYPARLNPLSATSRRIGTAAESLGLRPFRLPLAIRFDGADREPCVACTTCDTFACAIGAKNDVATVILPPLLSRGMELRPNTVVTGLSVEGRRVAAVETVDRTTGASARFRARVVVLAAGALGSPHLLLGSGLGALNPAGEAIGRYLMRHSNAIAYGVFPDPVDPEREFHKQLGIHDFYFGHPAVTNPAGKLGGVQQVQSPPVGLIRHHLPAGLGHLVSGLLVPRATGLLVMAEDQPRPENRLVVDRTRSDRFGLPRAQILHQHTARDELARRALLGQACRILRAAGAAWVYQHYIDTFSHVAGTVRMGRDARSAPLDENCRFRGLDNLFVVDASVMPTVGGLNPSLTITANALRVGEFIAGPFGG